VDGLFIQVGVDVSAQPVVPAHVQRQQQIIARVEDLARVVFPPRKHSVAALVCSGRDLAERVIATVVRIPGHGSAPFSIPSVRTISMLDTAGIDKPLVCETTHRTATNRTYADAHDSPEGPARRGPSNASTSGILLGDAEVAAGERHPALHRARL